MSAGMALPRVASSSSAATRCHVLRQMPDQFAHFGRRLERHYAGNNQRLGQWLRPVAFACRRRAVGIREPAGFDAFVEGQGQKDNPAPTGSVGRLPQGPSW